MTPSRASAAATQEDGAWRFTRTNRVRAQGGKILIIVGFGLGSAEVVRHPSAPQFLDNPGAFRGNPPR